MQKNQLVAGVENDEDTEVPVDGHYAANVAIMEPQPRAPY